MARVHLSAGLRDLTGGVANIEIEASTVGRLIKSLDQMFPGIGSRLSEGSSVAINGEILTDAEYETIPASAEIHFLDILQGG